MYNFAAARTRIVVQLATKSWFNESGATCWRRVRFQSSTSEHHLEMPSSRSVFKETPVNPSLLKYIDRIGVGKPKRSRRRKATSAFLSPDEERERFSDGWHKLRSTVPPAPFPSPGREEQNAVKRFPVKLLKSVGDAAIPFPKPSPNMPEVAIAGRSNVGKSTLLNALMCGSRRENPDAEEEIGRDGRRRNRRGKPTGWTARLPRGLKAATSSKPGETRALSFYQLSAKLEAGKKALLILVDLPGYGFAYASEAKAQEWQSLMHSYLLGRGKPLKRILLLIDARHGMKRADFEFLEALQQSLYEQTSESKNRELPPIQLVLTKCDLVSRSDLARRVVLTQRQLSDSLRRQSSALPIMLVSAQMEGQAGVLELQKELATMIRPL